MLEIDLRAHACQRAAQLMRGIADETLLLLLRHLEAVEHLVHGPREASDLVISRRLGHTPRELLAGDARHFAANALDRRERSPDEEERPPRNEQHENRHAPAEEVDKALTALVDFVEAGADDHRVNARGGLDRPREHTEIFVEVDGQPAHGPDVRRPARGQIGRERFELENVLARPYDPSSVIEDLDERDLGIEHG